MTGRGTRHVLQSQRLRTGYIVELLDSGLPLSVVLRAAGVTTLHSLSRYPGFLAPVAEERALELMRGGAG
ncbi:hypothetical protein [Kitasatospora sp. NPDC059817]|uniref:hypothetical protein n=1 Tax=Kitasatospora sp. NPDC059817 TaxID=3346961 RepID=UPI003663A5F2